MVKIVAKGTIVHVEMEGSARHIVTELAIASINCVNSIAEIAKISDEDAADLVISAIQEHLIMIKEGEDDTD